jgi:hypothetical protein
MYPSDRLSVMQDRQALGLGLEAQAAQAAALSPVHCCGTPAVSQAPTQPAPVGQKGWVQQWVSDGLREFMQQQDMQHRAAVTTSNCNMHRLLH